MRKHTVIKVLICVLLLIFVLNQLIFSLYKPVSTVSADFFEAADGLNVNGTIIRQESIVNNTQSGALHFVVGDGARVAKDGTIADIYQDASASVTVSRIEQIKSQISDIEEMQGYNDVQAADLNLANNRVSDALNSLVRSSSAGNYSQFKQNSHQLFMAINRRQIITGEQTDFSEKLTSLNQELQSLQASLPNAIGKISAASSGYFVSGIDGYESVLLGQDLENITAEFLKDIKPQPIDLSAVGKIVSDYEWYIAATVSIDESLKYKEGDSLAVKTSIKSCPELQVIVKRINISETSDDAVLILACQQMNSELASIRTVPMTVVKKTYSGLKLPQKSLRVVDGVTGVYVVSGITLKFVPVNVIYNTNGYIICEQQRTNDLALRLYDEVVVKGKRLYDGKIVN